MTAILSNIIDKKMVYLIVKSGHALVHLPVGDSMLASLLRALFLK
jgi:hypothetical protein